MSKRSASTAFQSTLDFKKCTKTTTQPSNEMASPPTRSLKRILVIGLSGHAPGAKPPSQPRGKFRQGLKVVSVKAKEAGLDLEMMQIKPSAFPAALRDIKEKLKSEPDGLVIGNGIRGTAAYTLFFEDLVNASREITPRTRLAFNTSPDDILECCLRNFAKRP